MSIRLEDRWYRPRSGGDRARSSRYGQQPRFRAHFTNLTGQRRSKAFHSRLDAERWLVKTEVAHLLKGDA
ncbi:hypothetical protein ACWD9K_33250 [Streptomyces sp. 900116325]|uniref:hypothetical protein n=1 Tax=unclassified Streptomyces TaxID=2593676 RepID=UPI0033B83AD9